MEITRHFTATSYIVYDGKVLLHKHKKLGLWLGFGGHIDRDELPEEAACREIKEETGLDVDLYWQDAVRTLPRDEAADVRVVPLNRPVHVILENVNEFHQHIDMIYYARATTDRVRSEEGVSEYCWFTAEELDATPGLQENVVIFGKEAIKVISNKLQ